MRSESSCLTGIVFVEQARGGHLDEGVLFGVMVVGGGGGGEVRRNVVGSSVIVWV
jgi:hypothetical protein